MTERFVTFWPVEARLVHIRDLGTSNPWRALCSTRWVMDGHYAEDYDVPRGDEHLLCATCTKIRQRREQPR